jgi:hypothetical protein
VQEAYRSRVISWISILSTVIAWAGYVGLLVDRSQGWWERSFGTMVLAIVVGFLAALLALSVGPRLLAAFALAASLALPALIAWELSHLESF